MAFSGFRLDPLVLKGIPEDRLYEEWTLWHRALEHILEATGVSEDKKLSSLMAYGGKDLQKIYYALESVSIKGPYSEYGIAIKKLEAHFKPKHHAIFARHKFWEITRDSEETVDDLVMKIRAKAELCIFGKTEAESLEIAMMDKLLMLMPQDLKEKLLQKADLTFDEAIKIIKAHDATKSQVRQLGGSSTANRPFMAVNQIRGRREIECFRCGSKFHKADSDACPAKHLKCRNCKQIGHFAIKCRNPPYDEERRKRPGVFERHQKEEPHYKKRRIEVRHLDESEKEQDKKPQLTICNIDSEGVVVVCMIGDLSVGMLVDSGTARNIIDETTWRLMLAKGFKPKKEFNDHSLKFRGYGNSELKQLLAFESDISVKNGGRNYTQVATFYVIKNGSRPLLSRGTAEALQILKITIPDVKQLPINEIGVSKVPFPKIKGIRVHLSVKADAIPVQLPLRRAPVAIADRMKLKLDELEQQDIIEKVHGPSQWISALVPVVKNDGDIRLCVDLRRLNEAIEREHHPLPNFEDILPRLKGAKVFSVLDIKSAYHQCELDEKSRPLTTFLTQWGQYRYKRLVFGVSCAPEKFQKVMELILSSCKNVVVFIDDLLIYGADEIEHDKCLEKVLTVLEEHKVLLNAQKCKIKMSEVIFLGHRLTSNGIYPTDDKVTLIQGFRAPQSREEVRSFLGLVCYVAKFIPNLSTITFPLRELLKKEVEFKWDFAQQEAFEKLKHAMVQPEALAYFDPSHETRLVADASPVGLGAVLIQFKDEGPRIISFAAKSLTETERRYCQTEKEALALVWSVERFGNLLLGIQFELETDHQALESIFGPNSRPCARIERWVLRLQSFRFKVRSDDYDES